MEPFMLSDQYNFVRLQTQHLVNGHATVNDSGVLDALKALVKEKVFNMFEELNEEQMELLDPIVAIEEKAQAEAFLEKLNPYVIPFKTVSEQTVKKLFPKAKKLKLPDMESINFKELSYFGWDDKGSNKKYIIAPRDNKLVGLHGAFRSSNKKGICALCNRHEEVGMFMAEVKASSDGTYTKRGNYICCDSWACNRNITNRGKLDDFIELLKK
jgi:hypothetical protein